MTCNGVRQGGILSPKLYAFYIDDLSTILNNLNVGCYIGFTCVNHLFYADDMCLLAPSALGLQILLRECEKYGFSHDILYNPTKSMCLVIPPNNYKLSSPAVTLNDSILQYTNSIKYLGVFLTTDFNDNIDVQRQLRCLYASANTVMSKFKHCSLSAKKLLIDSYCLNLYCSYLWCKYTKSNIAKLRVAYNNIYRKLLGYSRRDSASAMLAINNVQSFGAKLRKVVYSFRQRINRSENYIVMCLNSNGWIHSNYMYKHWDYILHSTY